MLLIELPRKPPLHSNRYSRLAPWQSLELVESQPALVIAFLPA